MCIAFKAMVYFIILSRIQRRMGPCKYTLFFIKKLDEGPSFLILGKHTIFLVAKVSSLVCNTFYYFSYFKAFQYRTKAIREYFDAKEEEINMFRFSEKILLVVADFFKCVVFLVLVRV